MNFNELVNESSIYFTKIQNILSEYKGSREQYLSLQEDFNTIQADLQNAYNNHDAAMLQDTYNVLMEFYDYIQGLIVVKNDGPQQMQSSTQQPMTAQPQQYQQAIYQQAPQQSQQPTVQQPPQDLVNDCNQTVTRYYAAIKNIVSQEDKNNSKLIHRKLCDCDAAITAGDYGRAYECLADAQSRLAMLERKTVNDIQQRAEHYNPYTQTMDIPEEPQPEINEKSAEMYQRQIILLKGEFRGLRDRLPIGSHAFKQFKQAIHYADMASDYEAKGDFNNAYTTWTTALDELKAVYKGD